MPLSLGPLVVTIEGHRTGCGCGSDEGIVSVTGAAEVGRDTLNSRGVDYPISSLKVTTKLHETRVSVTSTTSN